MLATAIGLIFPLVVRYVMDAAFVERSASRLGTIALWLLALFTIQGALNFGEAYLLGVTGERLVARLRIDLFAHLVRFSSGFHAGRTSGELTSRLASDCSMIQAVMGHQLADLLRQLLYLVGSLTLLALLHWQLMLTTLAVAPIVVVFGFAIGRALRRRSTEVQDRLLVLEGGRIVEQETHADLVDAGGLYGSLYRGQQLTCRGRRRQGRPYYSSKASISRVSDSTVCGP